MGSLTAERLYAGFPGSEVKSAGTKESARTLLTREHVQWADLIFVMEPDHLEEVQDRFGDVLAGKQVICLDIPDIYNFLEPALIEELRMKLSEWVEVPGDGPGSINGSDKPSENTPRP